MRLPKIRLGSLMLTVVFIGVGLSELRAYQSLTEAPSDANLNLFVFGAPFLTVGNLLAFLLILRVPAMWRTGRLQAGPFWWGFQVTTWGSLAAFGLVCLALGYDIIEAHLWPGGPTIVTVFQVVEPYLPRDDRVNSIINIGIYAITFGAPILALGLLGGLVAWATGVEAELRFRRRRRRAATPKETATASNHSG